METSFLTVASSTALFTLIAYVIRLRAECFRLKREVDHGPASTTQFIDNLPGVVYRRRLDGESMTVTMLQGDVEELTGYSRDAFDLETSTFQELIHPEDLEMIRTEIRRAADERHRFRMTYRIRRGDGSWRWIADQGAAIYSSTGEVLAIEGFLLDVTERKRLEEERVRIEGQYQILARYGRDVICLHDHEGRIIYVSPSVKRALGYDPGELYDRSFFALVHSDHRNAFRKKVERRVQEDGEHVNMLLRLRKKNGGFLTVQTTCIPELDDDGYFSRFVTCSRDVTALIRTRRELKSLKEKVIESERRGSVAIQNMGHELRTPLTGILGFAELLSDNLESEQRKFVDLIRESGERLLDSVTSLMEYASLESGFEVSRSKVNVTEIVSRQVDRFRSEAQEKKVVIQSVMESDEILAEVDQSALESMVSHLVHNAVKFTDSEGVVTIGVHERDNEVVMRIADTGIGIDDEFMSRMFEPFQQESSGLTREYEGIGLGLSITRRLVEMHGGRIHVESSKGEGSVFTLSVPSFAPETLRRMRETRLRMGRGHGSLESQPKKRVLAVDDNQPMRRIIERHLENRYEVHTAADEQEALARVKDGSYDFILIDINLGAARNGVDVMQAIRDVSGYARVPIVAITAYALPEERLRFTRAGFDGYVSKPFSRDQLHSELERLEKRARRARRPNAA